MDEAPTAQVEPQGKVPFTVALVFAGATDHFTTARQAIDALVGDVERLISEQFAGAVKIESVSTDLGRMAVADAADNRD